MSLFPQAPSPAAALSAIPTGSNAPSPASPYFLIFFASVEESTGKSWCPDCVRVEPTIEQHVPQARSSLIYVGQRADWKSPENAFRQAFGLKGVPTIVRVESSADQGSLQAHIASAPKLVEGEILDEAKLKDFLRI
ncbi:hypothetical protein BCR35DRAFT_304670 [Leucosporidium creatinivorum]|uniref:Thioredoxin domain-containing protein n=1 Tax=Leucosporidium creatinivorum TaxID=106004 RepID=A0A1Y2F6I1_9BASI|nr:hypothetical protein BCR35DRAFT_304670 [Leucosporidium creatinivorum]